MQPTSTASAVNGQSKLLRFFAGIALTFQPLISLSAQAEDMLVLNARLSVLAFKCATVAPNKTEESRLFDIGLISGRKYIELAAKEPAALERIWQMIPGPYLRVKGPSQDFLVGRVQGIVEEEMFALELKTQLPIDAFKRGEFSSRSCGVIQ